MSTSRKRLLWAFLLVTTALTLVLLAAEVKREPRVRPTPPGLGLPLSQDEATLRIGFFSIGPDDIEPRLVDEVILGLDTPVRLDLVHRSMRPVDHVTTGWSVGVRAPSLDSPREEESMEEGDDPFHMEARLEKAGDGKRMLACTLDAMFAGGGTKGAMIRVEAGPAVRILVSPPGWWREDDWRIDFVLGRTEGKTTGHWDVEHWREAIVEGLKERDPSGNRDRHAAALLPCPAAREELADGEANDELTARLLAGDARAAAGPPRSAFNSLAWELRTIWLKYPDMRTFAREHLIASGWRCRAGQQLAPRFDEDPELAVALAPPRGTIPRERIPAVVFLLIVSLAFVLPALLARAANPGRAAAWALAGCVLAVVQIGINGVGLTNFIGLPLLGGAAFGLRAALQTRTLASRVACAIAPAVIGCQVWMILGAPSLVAQVGSLAWVFLPFALLAATDPHVPAEARAATDRTLWWYAFTNLLLPVSFVIVDLVDRALGRDMVGSSLQGWPALLVLLASVVGLILAAVRFGGLRRRMLRTAAGASPA